MTSALTPYDWLMLVLHMSSLSLLMVGGAIATSPDMHRFIVDQQHWLSGREFANAITIAQVSPGPNALFVAVLGWNIGVNAAGGMQAGWWATAWGLGGALMCLASVLLPSSALCYVATQWAQRNRQHLGVRAFKAGLAPLVIGLLTATAWLLTDHRVLDQPTLLRGVLTLVSAWLMWKTKLHLLWMLAAGAALGALGWV